MGEVDGVGEHKVTKWDKGKLSEGKICECEKRTGALMI